MSSVNPRWNTYRKVCERLPVVDPILEGGFEKRSLRNPCLYGYFLTLYERCHFILEISKHLQTRRDISAFQFYDDQQVLKAFL